MTDTSLSTASSERRRKRPRAARACELCRAKKYRCDELYPCSQCKKQKVECIYDVADHVRQRILSSNVTSETGTVGQSQYDGGSGRLDSATAQHPALEEPIGTAISNGSATTQAYSPATSQWNQFSTRSVPAATGVTKEPMNLTNTLAAGEHNDEVSDVNPHTQNVEFHGKTSSIAFLAALQPQKQNGSGKVVSGRNLSQAGQPSLVSIFHNEAFSPEALANTQNEVAALEAERYYFRQAQIFLDGFFQNIHFIHPILDRQTFMARCEDLWFGRPERQPKCFIALYYSILSLGALIKTWDEEKLDGLGRLEWSRKFFNLTRTAIGALASMTAIESVQCLFFMAKISQNELNPSLAYLYLGWATRACFSAGFNRKQSPASKEPTVDQDQVARLWWGLYSLEIEVSFALGRPDSLGSDIYHNQVMPARSETETTIIPVMVDFARIVRQVSVSIYFSEGSILDKTATASSIELGMRAWLESVPGIIRPSILETNQTQKITRTPTWAKRQKLVLELRFYNVKMVLFRPFLTIAAEYKQSIPEEVEQAVVKCAVAARSTIELMHEMYCQHAFFRTWWYNTTYITYAASIILCYGLRVADRAERADCLKLGQQAVEILDAMEESTVAVNASQTIKQILASAEDVASAENVGIDHDQSTEHRQSATNDHGPDLAYFADDSLMSFFNLDENMDFLAMTFPLNSSHFPFLNDASDHV